VTQKLPFVTVKAAITLDGKLATVTRESQWITAEGARERSLALREEHDAILVGSGTVREDNPRLTRRLHLGDPVTPWTRVILDGDGDTPPHSQLLTDGGRTIIFTANPPLDPSPSVEIVPVDGRTDLQQVLAALHTRGIQSLIVEGGAAVHAEFIARGLWQKLVVFVAPMIVGGADAPSIFSGPAVSRLTEAYRFRFDRAEFVGRDLMITAYPG
jgi:diaminohydroxyphosphoribosylaminopyrimidine deaminase/5-amino-6-(5-phosphoribosylamino)uracil reductase